MTSLESICVDLLGAGHRVSFHATGRSMMPTIRDGDSLIVAPLGRDRLRVGEIILYAASRGLTAHRIIEGGDAELRARGDAPGSAEETVGVSEVIGRVEALCRQGRRIDLSGFFARCSYRVTRAVWHLVMAVRARLSSDRLSLIKGVH